MYLVKRVQVAAGEGSALEGEKRTRRWKVPQRRSEQQIDAHSGQKIGPNFVFARAARQGYEAASVECMGVRRPLVGLLAALIDQGGLCPAWR